MILTASSIAAVTVDQGNWPTDIGDVYDYYANNSSYNFGYTLPGTPPWDLSSAPHDRTVTSSYITPSSAPGGSSFPAATLAIQQHDPNDSYDTYTFHNSDAGGFYLLGIHDEDPTMPIATVALNSPLTLIPFPAQLGTTWSDSTTYTVIIFSYPVTISGEVVAEGQVTTPYGTRAALLARVMLQIHSPTGIQYSTAYEWLVPNVGSIASATVSDTSPTPEQFAVADSVLTLHTAEIPDVQVQTASMGMIRALYQ